MLLLHAQMTPYPGPKAQIQIHQTPSDSQLSQVELLNQEAAPDLDRMDVDGARNSEAAPGVHGKRARG